MNNIYSTSKAIYHTDRIKSLQEGRMIVPTLLQVDLTAYCNDSCIFCSYRKPDGYNNKMLKLIDAIPGKEYKEFKPIGKPTKEGSLPEEFAITLPKMMKEAGIPAIEITGGGEPTLWNGFDELVRNLKENQIEIGLVTNASNLSKERIDLLGDACTWIRFSMDASNPKLHQQVHHTPMYDFDRRIEHIKKFVTKKIKRLTKNITIGISFIITPENYDNIEDSIFFYKALGVDNIRFSWMYDKTKTAGLDSFTIETLKKSLVKLKETYENRNFKIYFESGRIESYSEENDFKKCYMQRFVWSIGANAKVYPCCIVKYWDKMELADLHNTTLKQIIEDQNINQRMDKLNPKGCPPCWLGARNKNMASAIEKPIHANFV